MLIMPELILGSRSLMTYEIPKIIKMIQTRLKAKINKIRIII